MIKAAARPGIRSEIGLVSSREWSGPGRIPNLTGVCLTEPIKPGEGLEKDLEKGAIEPWI